ncbi:phosphatase PAP2 family protein [Flavobacterium sp. UBA6031]|uniref:phosphatase PAP2 family protein n=1 Tax=Flavobacterium sp. UBA6031 TaxID=1946551 RepID=UPI0025C70D51|nr:phosphatase PAP2 family protein [Flavobacterium sp. UBA6031]
MKKYLLLLLLFPAILGFSQNADINILRDINLNRNKQLDGFYRGITNSAAPVAIGTPIILYGISLLEKDSANKQKAIFVGVSVITATAIATLLKYAVNRPRPFITYPYLDKVTDGGSPSFPSGHTSDAFALATSLSIAYPKWYVIAPSFAWAGAVGFSRMDLGVHYPSDVLAGAILGAGSAYVCYKVNQLINQNKKKKLKSALNNF